MDLNIPQIQASPRQSLDTSNLLSPRQTTSTQSQQDNLLSPRERGSIVDQFSPTRTEGVLRKTTSV